MNYRQIAAEARKRYDAFARAYKAIDASKTDAALREHYGQSLAWLCQSFAKPITALDLGCGTGRYFQYLENVEHLVGIDVSPEMLKQAKQPVGAEKVRIPRIDLISGDLLEHSFAPQSFDLIYSIGVLGEYSPLDSAICNKLFTWLKPGGKFFFTIVDATSKPTRLSLKRRAAEALFPFLPEKWKSKIRQERLWKSLYLTETQLRQILSDAELKNFSIARYEAETEGGWVGAHFNCLIEKPVAESRHLVKPGRQQNEISPP